MFNKYAYIQYNECHYGIYMFIFVELMHTTLTALQCSSTIQPYFIC